MSRFATNYDRRFSCDFPVSSASAMLLKIVEILVALILALYTLASLPALAAAVSSSDFLRRVSSPIFVFAVLNASIVLLSFSRISPPKRESTASSSSSPPPIGAETEDEFEIRHETKRMIVAAVAEDEIEVERNEISGRLEIVEDCGDVDDRCLEMVQAAEEEDEEEAVAAAAAATECDEEEVVEELSNAEFNRIIEAFLEKQKRFHYQENLSILV